LAFFFYFDSSGSIKFVILKRLSGFLEDEQTYVSIIISSVSSDPVCPLDGSLLILADSISKNKFISASSLNHRSLDTLEYI
jgi:hypothetical protein